MNWKNRILNKTTLLSLIGVVIYLIFKISTLLGFNPDAQQYRDMYDIFACLIMVLAIFGIITDPNTPGITDGGSHDTTKNTTQNTTQKIALQNENKG